MSSGSAVKKQQDVQREVAANDQKGGKKPEAAMQAGARPYPRPPFPAQHQSKPGHEFKLDPAPLYDAPFYLGSKKLEGKVALITGGDSGIGRSVAILFAREGADVAIVHLGEDRDAADTAKAVEKEGQRALVIKGDVRDSGFCKTAVEQTLKELGQLDVLVNNAAFQVHTKDIADLSDEHFDETLKTNLYGYFYMAKAAVPHLKQGSAIINTGSVTGHRRQPGAARLFDDQGWYPRLYTVAGRLAAGQGHPGQLRRAGAGMDAPQSVRQGS